MLQLALRFTESWAVLVARGRLTQTPARFEELLGAVLSHPLTDGQLRRVEAAPRLLPIDMSLGVRRWAWEPAAQEQRRRLTLESEKQRRQHTTSSRRQQRQERRAAAVVVEAEEEALVAALAH